MSFGYTDRRKFLQSGSVAALVVALNPGMALAQGAADQDLRQVMDRIFWGDMRLSPTSLTALGLDTGVDAGMRSRLDPAGKAADLAGYHHARHALDMLASVDRAGLSEIWQVRHDIVKDGLEKRLGSQPFGIPHVGSPYRISQQDGAYFSIPDFLDSRHPVETTDDAEAYLARLAALPFLLDDESSAQAQEASSGYLAPGWSLELVDSQMGAMLAPAPAESGMVQSLVRRAAEQGIAGDWQTRAAAIVEQGVYPALVRQRALMQRLQRDVRAGDGMWRLPHGEEIYARALQHYTTTDLGPEEIHAIGLEQVAEISSELDGILRGAGLAQGSVGQRLLALNGRPDQLYPDTNAGRAQLLASLNDGMASITARLPDVFLNPPTLPLDIRRVPVEIQDGASNGYYNRAALDGSRPAIYWINLKSTADWPKYSLPSLTYHEGNPGHHLQLSIMQQAQDLPLLLKTYFNSAYTEGWALYAEMLADELGAYSGLEKAGALQSWLFRAARLVVDTGMHAKRWSAERATRYFVDTVAFTPARSRREIERYCVMPGQACSYKIGQNFWVAQRARAQAELGDRFDLRQFHEVLHEGIMPLSILEQRITAWIAKQQAG